jgi:hypothetical protein
LLSRIAPGGPQRCASLDRGDPASQAKTIFSSRRAARASMSWFFSR